jgi:LysM repeat protein
VHYQCTLLAAFLVSATFAVRNPLASASSSVRSPVKRLLPAAAVPAVAGLAAAIALTHSSSAPVTDEITEHSTATLGQQAGVTATPLVSLTHDPSTGVPVVRLDAAQIAAMQPKGKHHASQAAAMQPKGKHHRTLPATYVVQSGDTLASIAQQLYSGADYWPTLYSANRATVRDASQLQVGQVLAVPGKPAKIPSVPAQAASVASTSSAQPSSSAGQAQPSTPSTPSTATSGSTASSGSSSSFQACVIAAESGGNAQVMSSAGYYGLYQFSASTWAAYGGNPADFGHASVAEQNQVFDNAIAAGGASNWSQYDGC